MRSRLKPGITLTLQKIAEWKLRVVLETIFKVENFCHPRISFDVVLVIAENSN